MFGVVSKPALDRILTLQLIVGWAGEGRTDPPRLGWWRTALGDEFGGDDLFRRLTPRTWRWAVLEAARAAARKVDALARARAADADELISLYRFGFHLDEQLDDRLAEHKRATADPVDALPGLAAVIARWDREAFATWLAGQGLAGQGAATVAPSSIGRRLTGDPPDDPVATAVALVAALAPLDDVYPAPHWKLSPHRQAARDTARATSEKARA